MTVDISKVKPGDAVLVWALVLQNDGSQSYPLEVKSTGCGAFWPDRECIAEHHPKALEPGDRVKSSQYGAVVLTIVAIDDGWAWLKDGVSWRIQDRVANLERVYGAPGEGL